MMRTFTTANTEISPLPKRHQHSPTHNPSDDPAGSLTG